MAVLIFSMPGDLHTAAVEWSLRRKGVEIDKVYMPDFPQRGSISCEVNSSDVNFLVGDRKIRYKDYDTVWFRRFSSAVPSGLLAQGDLTAAKRSWIELSRFLIEFPRGNAFCLNPPESQAMRDNKVFQLGVARDCGLLIPLTLVGTNHEDLAAFITTNSRDGHETIVKPLVPTMWSRSDGTKVTLAVSIVTLGDLEEADVSSEPLIYQRRVQKAYEVRLTVMGQMMFAVKLESQAHPDSQLDFRNAKDWRVLGHELIVIPNDIRVKIRRFCDRLQTPFGTMDFIVTIDDDWVFLESNTMGNFLWMEDCNPQIPLLDCFTEFLCSKDPMFKYVPETNGSLCRFSEFQADREFMLAFEKDDIQHVRYEFPFIVED